MTDVVALLGSFDLTSLILLFWYTTLLEIPRYFVGAVVVMAMALSERRSPDEVPVFPVSVLLVGHNEAAVLRHCVLALSEQAIIQPQVIVVDDGSDDAMSAIALELQRKGYVNKVFRLRQRGGKSAGVNFGLTACTGDIVVIADIDTSFDRDALLKLCAPFADPQVAAVSGDLGVRNAGAGLITRFQAIEYTIGLSLGRRVGDLLQTMPVVSGAFGAFRRRAIMGVGVQDVEVGEDADLTMKLRRAGWRIRFAPAARALTLVPETIPALVAQRLRWDRGLVTIWLRKFRGAFDPRAASFNSREVATLLDVLVFQVALALAFPVYVVWLFYRLGDLALPLFGATLLGYAVLDLLAFLAAAAIRGESVLPLLPYLPLYTLLQVTLMRSVRLVAIIEELIFRRSYRDPYVPAHVMRQVERD